MTKKTENQNHKSVDLFQALRLYKPFLSLLIGFFAVAGISAADDPALKANDSTQDLPVEKVTNIGAEKIVVTSSRTRQKAKDAIVATEVLSADLIANAGRKSLAQLLATHAGLFVGYDHARGNFLMINGLPAEYSLILIDGKRVIGRNDNANHLGRIMLNNVERIEIVKGANSAVYGSEAIAGVVNIITKSVQDEWQYNLQLGGGQLQRYLADADLGFQWGSFKNNLSVNFQQRGQYAVSEAKPDLRGRSFEQYGIANKSKFSLNEKNSLGLDIDFNRRFEKGVSEYTNALVDENKRNNIGNASLFYDFNADKLHQLHIEANYSYFDDRYLQDYRPLNKADVVNTAREDYGQLSTQYTGRINSFHRVSIGVENIFERMQTDRVPDGPKARQRNAVYLQDEMTLPFYEKIKLMPGVRLDTDTYFGQNYLPRLALRYDLWENYKVQAAYGWGFRAPSLKEMYYNFMSGPFRILGNENLKSENSQSLTVKNELSLGENFSVALGGFYHDIKDKINRAFSHKSGTTDVYTHVNVNKVYSRGIETTLKARLPLGFCLNLGYSYNDSYDVDNSRVLDSVARHSAQVTFSYDNHALGTNITFTSAFFSARPYYNKTIKVVEYKNSFSDLQLQLNQRVYKNVSFFIIAENLSNEFNETTLIRPPRGIWGGFSVKN